MKFIPILFSTPMVQAINEGRKTMTRRVMKPQPDENGVSYMKNPPIPWVETNKNPWKPWLYDTEEGERIATLCPYGQIGDVLWVRETVSRFSMGNFFAYKADNDPDDKNTKWLPSIFMPKAACRTFLEITNIRVERLNDISEEDSIAEGVVDYQDGTFKNYFKQKGFTDDDGVECLSDKASFISLWSSINGIDSWQANPFVWVVEFKRIPKPNNFN